jgi:hypothetical protein
MSSPPTAYLTDSNARQDARKRMLWKLLAVAVALGAFTIVRELERARDSYNEQRTRPIVIVEQSDLNSLAPARLHDGQLITAEAISKTFTNANEWKDERLQDLSTAINKIKYQDFTDDNAIVDRLDQEILAESDYNKKSFLAIEDAENKAAASRLPDLSQDRFIVENSLKAIYKTEKQLPEDKPIDNAEFNAWISGNSGKEPNAKEFEEWRGKLAKGETISKDDLLRWLTAIKTQSNNQIRLIDLKGRIAAIDARAQQLIKAVYTELKPQLPQLIKGAVNAPKQPESLLSFFHPRLVLDSSSGIHVIYQTLWLTCVLILILAVVFLLIAALRPVPVFARATDAIKDHTGELFKRSEGAGPQLAKSLVVSAAALGVGTAVAVSSTTAVGKRPPRDEAYIDGSGPDGNSGRGGLAGGGKPGAGGRGGSGGEAGVMEHVVTFSPPIVYPSPVTVTGPTSVNVDAASLDPLRQAIDRIKTPSAPSDTELRQRMIDVAQGVTGTALTQRLGTIDVPALSKKTDEIDTLGGNLSKTSSAVEDLSTWRKGVEKDFATTLASLRDQLAETNLRVEELQNNSLERPQNSGGRNLFTSATQVFRSNRYLVTAQSVRVLSNLMIKLPVKNCATSTTAPAELKPCCGTTATAARYSCDLDIDTLLTTLSSMVGDSPQDESSLMNRLYGARRVDGQVVGRAVVQHWKSIILKYTRIAY